MSAPVLHRITDLDADGRLPQQLIDDYRRNGFVRVRGILTADEVARFQTAEKAFVEGHRAESLDKSSVFTQLVNVWRVDNKARELTLHPTVATVATQLAGIPLRIWHDHLLVKEPHNNKATHFHQDEPFWPHDNARHSLSAWIALVDVPPDRGCMSFLPGTQTRTGLRPQNLHDEEYLFSQAPELRWFPRVTVPLRAGDCTFHSSFTAHMAMANSTDLPRFAHVNIYMDAETAFNGTAHAVTDPLGLTTGDVFDGEMFPPVP